MEENSLTLRTARCMAWTLIRASYFKMTVTGFEDKVTVTIIPAACARLSGNLIVDAVHGKTAPSRIAARGEIGILFVEKVTA